MKDKDGYLVDYLINKGKAENKSGVKYALDGYDAKKFNEAYYHYKYYQKNADKWKEYKNKTNGKFVYVLLNKGKVIWVGSTTDIYNRLQNHKSVGRIFTAVMLYDFTPYDITEKEMRQIEYYLQNVYAKCLEGTECRVTPFNAAVFSSVESRLKSCVPIVLEGWSIKSILMGLGRSIE